MRDIINNFLNNLDKSKSCKNCQNYIEPFVKQYPEGEEYDGDVCGLSDYNTIQYGEKRVIYDIINSFNEYRWAEYEGLDENDDLEMPSVVANLCVFYSKKTEDKEI
jgi:hypothetical protein